jgi:hypothetical protein
MTTNALGGYNIAFFPQRDSPAPLPAWIWLKKAGQRAVFLAKFAGAGAFANVNCNYPVCAHGLRSSTAGSFARKIFLPLSANARTSSV